MKTDISRLRARIDSSLELLGPVAEGDTNAQLAVRILSGEVGPCGSCEPPGILQNVNAGEDGRGQTQCCDECGIYCSDASAASALRRHKKRLLLLLSKGGRR